VIVDDEWRLADMAARRLIQEQHTMDVLGDGIH
jgi:hypothetical protein